MARQAKQRNKNSSARLPSPAFYLNQFNVWMSSRKGIVPEEATEHSQHVEELIDFLGRERYKLPASINETDLRIFLYRNSVESWLETPAQQCKLLTSVALFYECLSLAKSTDDYGWLRSICSDRDYYLMRCKTFRSWDKECMGWESHCAAWRKELYQDLYRRCLVPSPYLDEETAWSAEMGPLEKQTYVELTDFLVKRRNELMAKGMTDFHKLRAELDHIQKMWMIRPKKKYNGKSPLDVVKREQEKLVPVH